MTSILEPQDSTPLSPSLLKYWPIIVFVVGTIVAGVRLEGRVNSHDQLFQERKDQEIQQWQSVKDQLTDIKSQLQRIERKMESQQTVRTR